MATIRNLPVARPPGPATCSPDQQRLVDLATRIAQARAARAAWRDALAAHASAYTRSVEPLIRSLAALRRETVFRFDRLLDQPVWNQAERRTLVDCLTAGATELLDLDLVDDDAPLRALFDKHSIANTTAACRGDAAVAPAQDARDNHSDNNHSDNNNSDSDTTELKSGHPQRRKPPARRAPGATPRPPEHSLRDLFRKLASALHPDRETDPVQRERKTALMQEANVAYAGGDLLTLIELEAKTLAPADFDAGRVRSLSAERIAEHAAVLGARLAELMADTDRAEARFRSDFGLPPGRGMNPGKLVRTVREEARALRADIAAQQAFLRMLDDRVEIKAWLREERRRARG